MLPKRYRENLEKLSKEQLIKIIDDYYEADFLIGETLVDESKCHISSEKAVNLIRKYSCDISNRYNFISEHLPDEVDFRMGKITPEQYREILLG